MFTAKRPFILWLTCWLYEGLLDVGVFISLYSFHCIHRYMYIFVFYVLTIVSRTIKLKRDLELPVALTLSPVLPGLDHIPVSVWDGVVCRDLRPQREGMLTYLARYELHLVDYRMVLLQPFSIYMLLYSSPRSFRTHVLEL